MGFGSGLLGAIERHAVLTGRTQIRLDVIDKNTLAKDLYLRRGFEETETKSICLLKPIFGFESVTTTIKKVA